MDFHDDHTSFGPAPTDGIWPMHGPGAHDHGFGEDAAGPGSTTYPGDSDPQGGGTERTGSPGGGLISVRVGGHEVTATATIDIDHDGHNETAIVEDAAGDRIAVTDIDGDGEADHAALLDDSGQVLDTAHLDPTGTWVADAPGDRNPYAGTGGTIGGAGAGSTGTGGEPAGGLAGRPAGGPAGGLGAAGAGTGGSDGGAAGPGIPSDSPGAEADPYSGGAGGPAGSGIGTSPAGGTGLGDGEQIEVKVGGHAAAVGASYDTDHDGRDETAVVRGPDGTTVTFSDTDGDGAADLAAVYDAGGRLVGTARYHEATGTWVEDRG